MPRFQIQGKTAQIFTLNPKTGKKTQLTSGDYNNRDGTFSRDGKFVAFVSWKVKPEF